MYQIDNKGSTVEVKELSVDPISVEYNYLTEELVVATRKVTFIYLIKTKRMSDFTILWMGRLKRYTAPF